MKKFIIVAVFAVFLVIGSPIFAQQGPKHVESEYYYVNVTLERIYPYPAGYVIQYNKGMGQRAMAYLPIEWFTGSATKGEIIALPSGQAWPSLTVYYKDGQFSHVRLYIHREYSHPTWGNIPQSVHIEDRFQDTDDFKLF